MLVKKIFILLISLSIGYSLPQINDDQQEQQQYMQWEENVDDDKLLIEDSISVQMKCSQDSSDVHCKFYFTNNGEDDYYLLKRNTPLEGLRSHYLTITHGRHLIKYEGPILNRAPVKKHEYILLPAGVTISSPSIKINRAYKFPHDGVYTIQYTGPLVYLSMDRMDTLQEDYELTSYEVKRLSQQESPFEQITIQDSSYLQKLYKEEEVSSNEVNEHKNVQTAAPSNCPDPEYKKVTKKKEKVRDATTILHREMCNRKGLPRAEIYTSTGRPIYQTWFGPINKGRQAKVLKSLKKMLQGLKGSTIYQFGGKHCDSNTNAYTFVDTNKVFLCDRYDTLKNSFCRSGYQSKRQILAHEWSHAFANTFDHSTEGGAAAKRLPPAVAVENADSYGYFYNDVYCDKTAVPRRPKTCN